MRTSYNIILNEEKDRKGNYLGLQAKCIYKDKEQDIEVTNVNGTSFPDVLLRVASNIIAWEMGLSPVYERTQKPKDP